MTSRSRLNLALSPYIICLGLGLSANQTWAQDLPAARSAFEAKQYDKVIELLGSSVDKLDRDGIYLLAQSHSEKDNHLAAIKLFEAALALNTKDFESKRRIGLEYVKMGKDKDALPVFREALEMNPKNEAAYLDIAGIYDRRRPPNKYELRLLFEDLIKQTGEKAVYISRLCELTTLEGQYSLSHTSDDKGYCDKGIKLNNREPKNYVYLATTYKETAELEQAQKYFLRAADSFSKSGFAQISAGDFFAGQKNFLKAYTYYKRASEASPDSIDAWQGLARSGLEIQKFAESYSALEKACKINRSAHLEVRKAMASLRQQKNNEWMTKFDSLATTCGLNKDN